MEQLVQSDKGEEIKDAADPKPVSLISDKLYDFLDPDQIKKDLVGSKKVRYRKTREELLDQLIEETRRIAESPIGSKRTIQYSDYDDLMPDFPAINDPYLPRAPSNSEERSLDVNPAVILGVIWNHLTSFSLFHNVDPESIPDDIYENFFEKSKTTMTKPLKYSAKIGSISEWIRELYRWYNSSDPDVGWNALFSGQTQIDSIQLLKAEENVFQMLVCLAVMYHRANRIYADLGKPDLQTFWDLTLEQRQGPILKSRPEEPGDRFAFRYSVSHAKPKPKPKPKILISPEEEEEQGSPIIPDDEEEDEVVPTLPAAVPPGLPLAPVVTTDAISSQNEIYYIYTLSAYINQIKRILYVRHLGEAIEETLGDEELMRTWRLSARTLLQNAQRDMKKSRNARVISLMKILEAVWKEFGGKVNQ